MADEPLRGANKQAGADGRGADGQSAAPARVDAGTPDAAPAHGDAGVPETLSARPDTDGIALPTVFADEPAYAAQADALAEHLGTSATPDAAACRHAAAAHADADERFPLFLRVGADGLTLMGNGMELRADLSPLARRIKPGTIGREPLVKAARLKGFPGTPHAVDATAGLGQDALLLAAAGFEVDLYESDPVIAALLRDGLRRAADNPALHEAVARMHANEGDGIAALRACSADGHAPDVVYLDPMFPARRKSAAVKKKFQLLHRLERPCADERMLLQAALDARPRKVVVKRPPKGPYLAGVKPAYSLTSKAVRYDCLVLPRS